MDELSVHISGKSNGNHQNCHNLYRERDFLLLIRVENLCTLFETPTTFTFETSNEAPSAEDGATYPG